MTLNVVSNEKSYVRVALQGEIHASKVSPSTPDQLAQLIGNDWATKRVLVDFGGIAMAGSAAIGWLLAMNRKFREAGGKLVLHSMRPDVARTFQLFNVRPILSICPDEQSALAALEDKHE